MTAKAGNTTRSSRARRNGRREGGAPGALLTHPAMPGFEELLEKGKVQGYVREEDIEDLFEDDAEAPDSAQLEAIHNAFVDAGIEAVQNENELQQTTEDIQLDTQLDRIEAEGEPLNADAG